MRRTPGFAIFPCAVALVLAAAAPTPAAQIMGLGANAVMESRRGDCHALSLVALDERKRPVIRGRVCLRKSAALHYLTRRGDQVVAVLWNQVEIYSFADPRRPAPVRSIALDETHPSWGGGGLVHEPDRLLILGTTVSAALTTTGPPADWTVRNLEPTDELRRRTEGLYDQRAREQGQGAVRIEGGVFEVFWTEKRTGPGAIEHRQHLRVVESGATLPIDTWLETID